MVGGAMSRARTAWKAEALKLDPKCAIVKDARFGVEQWFITAGDGRLIGWSRPGYDGTSMMAWMQAYYALGGTKE